MKCLHCGTVLSATGYGRQQSATCPRCACVWMPGYAMAALQADVARRARAETVGTFQVLDEAPERCPYCRSMAVRTIVAGAVTARRCTWCAAAHLPPSVACLVTRYLHPAREAWQGFDDTPKVPSDADFVACVAINALFWMIPVGCP